jgi:hypothetical protein
MPDVAGLPYTEVEFRKDATLVDPQATDRVAAMIQTRGVRDLLVLSHGWNNDMAEARGLYAGLLANVAAIAPTLPALAGRQIGVLAVLWPSKRFAERSLIPGGAAAIAASGTASLLVESLERLKGTFDAPDADAALTEAQALVPVLETNPVARRSFADALRSVITRHDDNDVDASSIFFEEDGEELLALLDTDADDDVGAATGGGGAAKIGDLSASVDAGGAAGLADTLGGVNAAALNLLNFVTYYQMKQRAGLVGEKGLNPIIRAIRAVFPGLRVHLAGHSFGARLVTAAAHAAASPDGVVCDSLALLQAAYSHYGLSQNYEPGKNGFFFDVVAKADAPVRGPVIVTTSQHDYAVGTLYALASRVAGQVASGLGDANDKFGGLGRNGAQKTPRTAGVSLLPVGGNYGGFAESKVFNLNGDAFISEHNDIRGPQVAYAILSAMAAT